MTLDAFYFLLTEKGQQLLGQLPPITPDNHLQVAMQLRQQIEPPLAQAMMETTLLRQEAAVKFSRAAEMYFARQALEQASSEVISHYRAQRFARAGVATVADLGCGIGGDSLALTAVAEVTGVDWNPVRLAMAQENVRVYGHGERFHPLQADLLELTPLPVQGAFFDPARRDENGRRLHSVHQYRPPLSLIDKWRLWIGETAVKISPGVDYNELPEDAEIEFISINGDVKEGVLWFGDLRSGVQRRATLLPAGDTLTTADLPTEAVAITEPKAYLYEPDKAVIRAHLVEAVAQQLKATKLDEEIAYLTADAHYPTPFARCYTIEDWFPFQLKRLRHYLRERNMGRVIIKKRGSPLEPDTLQRQLRLQGEAECILFLTQVGGEAAVLIGQAASSLTYPDKVA
jgi:SAM-dependent methyltransferase